MKRGFLNRKAKDKPLYDNGASASSAAVIAPSKQSPPSGGGATAISRPKKRSEPVVGVQAAETNSEKPMEPYAILRVPSLKMIQSKEPFSACILRPSTCSMIMNTPGFYTPLPPLNPTDVVFTKNTANMGIGLFSRRSVNVNQVIFSERPLLVFPQGLPIKFDGILSEEEAVKQYDLVFDDALRKALKIMTKEDVDTYMSLANCLPNSPPLPGIARTNAFGTGGDIEEENLQEGKVSYSVVGRLTSRINHDCTPNVCVKFDIPTFSLRVIALRDIKAGQQLFYCYCQPRRSVKERRRQLATYGFECQCKACANATPESDRLREEMDNRIQKVIEVLFANPQLSFRSLDPLLKLEKEIVREGLDFGSEFVQLLYIILQAYERLDNIPKRIEYLNKWEKITG